MRWVLIALLLLSCRGRNDGRRGERRAPPAEEAAADPTADPTAAALEALGYLSEGNEPLTADVGVVKHLPGAWPGTNLLVSAHDFEVTLADMDGAPLHSWRLRAADRPSSRSPSFRRAWLLPDGHLLAVVEGAALMRLDVAGRVVWSSTLHHHHDVHLVGDELHTLTREARKPVGRGKPVLEDQITVLDLNGKVLRRHSILKALQRSEHAGIIADDAGFDVLHTNSLKLLDGRSAAANPAFAAGNYLVSCRRPSALLVIDPAKDKVVWAQQGPWHVQHDARVLDDGRLMVFDNGAAKQASASRVYDLATMEETWRWAAGEGADYNTSCCGTNTLLPNGDLLFVLTDQGAAWEVTPAGEPVWEYHSPHRAGVGQRRVPRLWDVVRAPPAAELAWLAPPTATPATPTTPEPPTTP